MTTNVRADFLVCNGVDNVPVIHVLGDWRVGLSAWQLWHSREGTQGVDADALRRCVKYDLKRSFA
jgi:hypothetical protein